MERWKITEMPKKTIYDIAKEAGVSAATVSRVLTNNANVRPEKKKKILEVIEKYNFRPNALARGLSETKRKIIGVIMADIRNPFYANLFVACEQTALAHGYSLFLQNSLSRQETEETQLNVLEEQRVDAIILVGGRVDDLNSNERFVEKVNQVSNNIPIVITGKLDGTSCRQVRIDAIKSMDLIMNHLIGLNHRDIAIIGGYKEVASTFEKRQRYKQILAKHQIPYRKEFGENFGGYDYETGYEHMNKLVENGQIPTAVIATNDFAALGVMGSLAEHGLCVPKDVSIVSYDNTYICNMAMPKLTSIDYNYDLFAKMLITTVIAVLEKRETPIVQLVEPSLMVRESSQAARRSGLETVPVRRLLPGDM